MILSGKGTWMIKNSHWITGMIVRTLWLSGDWTTKDPTSVIIATGYLNYY